MRIPRPAARLAVLLAAAAVLASVAIACGGPDAAGTASASSQAPVRGTPWPGGTVGKYGLRVDPALLQRLPPSVGGLPLLESVNAESVALDDQPTAATLESFASATVATLGDPDWAAVTIMRLRPERGDDATYRTLRDQYADGGCSQAGGVSGRSTDVIGERTVDVARCAGGAVAYSVKLDQRTMVSVLELGPRRLGRQLLAAIE